MDARHQPKLRYYASTAIGLPISCSAVLPHVLASRRRPGDAASGSYETAANQRFVGYSARSRPLPPPRPPGATAPIVHAHVRIPVPVGDGRFQIVPICGPSKRPIRSVVGAPTVPYWTRGPRSFSTAALHRGTRRYDEVVATWAVARGQRSDRPPAAGRRPGARASSPPHSELLAEGR